MLKKGKILSDFLQIVKNGTKKKHKNVKRGVILFCKNVKIIDK